MHGLKLYYDQVLFTVTYSLPGFLVVAKKHGGQYV